MNTSDVNGRPGKGNFPPVSGGEAGTSGAGGDSGSSQGGLHDHDHAAATE